MNLIETLKLNLFVNGIAISESAENKLTQHGRTPFLFKDYATTGGITLILDETIYVNAPFDTVGYPNPEASLEYEAKSDRFIVKFQNVPIPVKIVPLPGYLNAIDSKGRPVIFTAFTHADRVRLSPVFGCTMSCKFCNIPGHKYQFRPVEQILEATRIAIKDQSLPVKHILMTGGTPAPKDYGVFDDLCAEVVKESGLPVDVMMPPRPRDSKFFSRLASRGVDGFSINIEVFDQDLASKIIPEKHRIGIKGFEKAIASAVEATGGNGKVRSLLLVGLESMEKTIEAVHFLARLGCDPVLSPFRSSDDIPLSRHPVPSVEFLRQVFIEAANVVEKYGVKLGPRCIPCQHNTMTFPDDSGSYYFS